ncbi:MAG: ATP/GTP-binding protein [Nitrososphaerota archaeon]
MLTILIIGPAGAGKTILSKKLAEWMIKNMYLNVGIVNLDPGIENLPYEASFDIRKYFTIKNIMNELNLGPNGAFIEAANRIAKIASKIVKEIANLNHEYIIVDTPGQMEIFVFRNFGPVISKEFIKYGPTEAIFLIDPETAETISDIVVFLGLSIATKLRLGIPVIPILNKIDKIDEEKADLFKNWKILYENISKDHGLLSEISKELLKIYMKYIPETSIAFISAINGFGIEYLYDRIRETFCECGEI